MKYIGQDFTKSVTLNLMPGISLPPMIYQVNISYVTIDKQIMNYTSNSFMSTQDMTFVIAHDVRDISVEIIKYGAFSSDIKANYSIRVDLLILLNLAVQLIKL